MNPLGSSSKVKIAKRVIEILEHFADGNESISVSDVVRRYGRPQSSTSELLAALREMGLLYRTADTRRFHPTPRLAALGLAGQPDMIRNGQLFGFMDRLAEATGHSVALFGMLGTQMQVYHWTQGRDPDSISLACGAMCTLADSAAGHLLLSALGEDQATKLLWRLKAEADAATRTNFTEISTRIPRIGQAGHATGDAGVDTSASVTAVSVPGKTGLRALALGVVYGKKAAVDADAMVARLRFGLRQCGALGGDIANPPLLSLVAN